VAIRYRSGWFRSTFNLAQMIIADFSALGVFLVVERHVGTDYMHVVLAAVVAATAQWLANFGLVATVMVLSQAPTAQVRGYIRHAIPVFGYNAIYGFSAAAFTPLHNDLGTTGIATFMGPLLAAQLFLIVLDKRTSAHTTERERYLRALEQEAIRAERAHDATLISLTHALDARDKETEGHSRRVVEYSRLIAVRLGIDGERLRVLAHGALLHDIGKIGVPDAILHKPAALTEEEWAIMRQHPSIGASMIEDVDLLKEARRLILHHHERWDGSGYPRGLRGTQIDLGARVFAIADAVDAITQDRPYRKAQSLDRARDEVRRHRGVTFDPDAVDAYLSIDFASLDAIQRLRTPPSLDLLLDLASLERRLAELKSGERRAELLGAR
jgi:putative nucleotidyltransferase with HDIG domain